MLTESTGLKEVADMSAFEIKDSKKCWAFVNSEPTKQMSFIALAWTLHMTTLISKKALECFVPDWVWRSLSNKDQTIRTSD